MHKLPSEVCSPVVVVCHDAGAANHIFAWLHEWFNNQWLVNHEIRLILDGPAKNIWLNNPIKSNNIKLYEEVNLAFVGVETVITGTGWASNLEYDAIELARTSGKESIAVIDHWVNYKDRFIRNQKECLPNNIWVTDEDAYKIALNNFKNINIKQMPNYYLSNLLAKVTPFTKNSINLLYVLEPIRNDWNKGVSGEFQSLDYFLENINKITNGGAVNIRLRPHPSDPIDKYNKWIEENKKINPIIDSSSSLIESISNAKWVVGIQTYALVVAATANRITWSSLPPWAPESNLPNIGIQYLRLK